jgi:hypothetical protein
MKVEEEKSKYVQYIRKDFQGFVVTYISVVFPPQGSPHSGKFEKHLQPWGIAWTKGPNPKDKVNVFFKKLPGSWNPGSHFKLFERFLERLKSD